jgi:dimeric dUTPase (all-alpha-NTP-PPase superfamily)
VTGAPLIRRFPPGRLFFLPSPRKDPMEPTQDKLEQLFAMQGELNDRIFAKKDIRDNGGMPLSMATLMAEAGRGDLGPNTKVNEWLGKYLAALDDESRELKEELLWKWWSKDHLDMQNIRVEIIDQLHFWISLALTAGMDAKTVFSLYMQKNAVNHKRQESDYSKSNKSEEDNRSLKV